MSSFITNLFPSSQGGKHDNILPVPHPPLHTRSSQNDPFNEGPNTPNQNSFITPVSTPQGSPSKNRNPPGANDLPIAFETSMKLTPNTFGSPTKGGRSQAGTPCPLGRATQWQSTILTLPIPQATLTIVSFTSQPRSPLAAHFGNKARKTHLRLPDTASSQAPESSSHLEARALSTARAATYKKVQYSTRSDCRRIGDTEQAQCQATCQCHTAL